MKQTWHILKKDVRYLRNEIGLLIVLSLAFAWVWTHASSVYVSENPYYAGLLGATGMFIVFFLAVTSTILVGLAVHAEAIPGDKQFWITRPYRWPSLLAAKLVFILLFVNLPVFIGRLIVVVADGIPVLPALSALLWSQMGLFFIIGIPTAAVAALTSGLVPFIFSTGALWFVVVAGINLFRDVARWPPAMDWIRDSVGGLFLIGICSSLLYMQYKSRRTTVVRIAGLALLAAVMMVYLWAPLSFALAIQSGISPQPNELSPVHVTVSSKFFAMRYSRTPAIDLGVEVLGIPEGDEANGDEMSVVLQAADGSSWKSGLIGMGKLPTADNQNRSMVQLDPNFVNAKHSEPLTLTATVYLTIYGNARTKKISVGDDSVRVFDDLVCSARRVQGQSMNALNCRSVSTLSNALVLAHAQNSSVVHPLESSVSYAPYPPFGFSPIQEGTFWWSSQSSEFTVVALEPIAHLRRDFQATGIRLDDVKVEPNRP